MSTISEASFDMQQRKQYGVSPVPIHFQVHAASNSGCSKHDAECGRTSPGRDGMSGITTWDAVSVLGVRKGEGDDGVDGPPKGSQPSCLSAPCPRNRKPLLRVSHPFSHPHSHPRIYLFLLAQANGTYFVGNVAISLPAVLQADVLLCGSAFSVRY